jgi:DNA-binding NtrC family response regulator
MKGQILIVEDDPALNLLLCTHYEEQGYAANGVETCQAAREAVSEGAPDLVLLDHHLPDGTGLDLLDQLAALEPEMPIIMMTGIHDLELAISAIKAGAYDFIHKPVQTEQLNHVVAQALDHRRLAKQMRALRYGDEGPVRMEGLVGQSRAMLEVSKHIALASQSAASVLITGESGTGKEMVARAIHGHSGLPGPFLAVNCAAIVDTLLESELFGHEKGAFTGAVARKEGKFELAQDGTLFLDEIGELALPLQAKLLRVLQEHTFERVGGTRTLSSNARIIAATNRDLDEEVQGRRFREDLLYRLKVVHFHLPPLRERREDIPLLVKHLLEKTARNLHKPPLRPTEAAQRMLERYPWPGNVRELENVLTRAAALARDDILTPQLLNLEPHGNTPSPGDGEAPSPLRSLDEVEAEHIQRVLHHTGGHKGRTCEVLGISRPALDRKIHKYELVVPK